MGIAKGYYSLIQYCPDFARSEALNIGVLLYCPSNRFLKAITDEGLSRIQCCFALSDLERDRVNALRLSMERRLRTEQKRLQRIEDLEQFVASRGNAIQISPPRPIKITDAEQDLRQLYGQLVETGSPAPAEVAHEIDNDSGQQRKKARRKKGREYLDLHLEELAFGNLRRTSTVRAPIFTLPAHGG